MTIAYSNASNAGKSSNNNGIVNVDLPSSGGIASRPDRNFSSDGTGNVEKRSPSEVSDEEMVAAVETILKGLGEDPTREGLLKTPKRVAEAMRFLTSGYDRSLEEIVNDAIFDKG
ncbi:MAG: GTP cyclohydrolase I FolE, partial [Okeania sp. SIO2H7]|nr:GTP cyclohydrolase I FolE [Okeania sp. SIO2H7]